MRKKMLALILVVGVFVTLLSGCAKDGNDSNSTAEVDTNTESTESNVEMLKNEWPTQEVTIICPWAVGGLADQVNRAMSEYGKAELGQQLLADNILGSGGAVALTEYIKEEPNSHKLIFGGEGSFAIAPLTSEVEYKFEDFVPVINIYSSTFILSANASTGVDSFEKFEEYVKSNVVKIATNGYNSSEALQGAGLIKEMGGDFVIVSYDGANEALSATVSGEVDFAIATEGLEHFSNLLLMPCYQWNRAIIVPKDHALANLDHPLTLAELARHPIVTYVFGFTGRSKLDEAFEKEGLTPKVVFTAADADVIKTYVRLGLGVGIVADMAHDPQTDLDLVSVSASHLFSPSITSIAFRRGTFLRGYMYRFVSLFAPHLSRDIIGQFLRSQGRAEAERIFESVQVPML